jgi:hypothetical protein
MIIWPQHPQLFHRVVDCYYTFVAPEGVFSGGNAVRIRCLGLFHLGTVQELVQALIVVLDDTDFAFPYCCARGGESRSRQTRPDEAAIFRRARANGISRQAAPRASSRRPDSCATILLTRTSGSTGVGALSNLLDQSLTFVDDTTKTAELLTVLLLLDISDLRVQGPN